VNSAVAIRGPEFGIQHLEFTKTSEIAADL